MRFLAEGVMGQVTYVLEALFSFSALGNQLVVTPTPLPIGSSLEVCCVTTLRWTSRTGRCWSAFATHIFWFGFRPEEAFAGSLVG